MSSTCLRELLQSGWTLAIASGIILSLGAVPCTATTQSGSIASGAGVESVTASSSVEDQIRGLAARASRDADWKAFAKDVSTLLRESPDDSARALLIAEQILPSIQSAGELLDEDGESVGEVLNEAKAVLLASSQTNGTTGLELSYRAVNTLRAAAECFPWIGEKQGAMLFLGAGEIARNLEKNPAFPSPSKSGLAAFLFGESRGHALLGNSENAVSAIRLAYEWGLVDFEQVLDEPNLKQLDQARMIANLSRDHQFKYRARIRPGIESAIDNFQPFRFDFTVSDAQGKRVTKSKFAGRLTVVDLWSTWCSPCKAEVPHLVRLQREFESRQLSVVGIAFEQGGSMKENQKRVDSFVKQTGINYPCFVGDDSVQASVPGNGGIPAIVFLDQTGKVRFALHGYHDYSQLATIAEVLLNQAEKSETELDVHAGATEGAESDSSFNGDLGEF